MAKNSKMKPSFHQTQKRQNQNIKWIYNKTAYVEFQINTPVLINFTRVLLALLAALSLYSPSRFPLISPYFPSKFAYYSILFLALAYIFKHKNAFHEQVHVFASISAVSKRFFFYKNTEKKKILSTIYQYIFHMSLPLSIVISLSLAL